MRQAPRGAPVSRLIVKSFAVSLHGYGAGPAQASPVDERFAQSGERARHVILRREPSA